MKHFPVSIRSAHPKEFALFATLRTPEKIQDFVNSLAINFEERGETCRSPLMVLRTRKAHCIEGAMLAAAAIWYHRIGDPLVFDLRTSRAAQEESDHVVALFSRNGAWGAISKTNHAVLRYRDPIYRTLRELALSYFHEYFLDTGMKTLRRYSAKPFNLASHGSAWLVAENDVWDIPQAIDRAPHLDLLTPHQARSLRRAEPIEIKAGKIVEMKRRNS